MILELKEIFELRTSSITPMNSPTNKYCLYSLPAFDDGVQPVHICGKDIGSNKYHVPDKCILFNKLNVRFKRVWRVDNDIKNKVCSTEFYPLIPKENIDYNYAYYVLVSDTVTNFLTGLNTNTSGSHKRIDIDTLLEIKYNIPSLKEQQEITSVLSAIDKKIELNNKIIKELETMSKELYDYWFVQFDFPNKDGKPYRTSGGAMTYNPTLKREIPLGWEVKTLLDIATYTNGLACQKFRPSANDDMLRVIKIKEMHNGFAEDTEFVKATIPEKVKVYDGDVLFSWSASLEVMLWAYGKGGLNQHIFKVTSEKYPREYYYYQLLDYVEHFQKIAESRKTTMGHITQEHLEQSRIVVPHDNNIVTAFETVAKPMFEKIIYLNQQNQELTTLRDWLLPMLMNGQVTIQTKQGQITNIKCINIDYIKPKNTRFRLWIATQGIAARGGNIDENMLKVIFNAMDDEDK